MTTNRMRIGRLEAAMSNSAEHQQSDGFSINAELCRWNPNRMAGFIHTGWRAHLVDERPSDEDESDLAYVFRIAWDHGWIEVLNRGLGVDELERLIILQGGPADPPLDANAEVQHAHQHEGKTDESLGI